MTMAWLADGLGAEGGLGHRRLVIGFALVARRSERDRGQGKGQCSRNRENSLHQDLLGLEKKRRAPVRYSRIVCLLPERVNAGLSWRWF
jgi:hypothetical protein